MCLKLFYIFIVFYYWCINPLHILHADFFLIKYTIWKYFLPYPCLIFYFISQYLSKNRSFKFWCSLIYQFYFFTMDCVLVPWLRNVCWIQDHKGFSCFSFWLFYRFRFCIKGCDPFWVICVSGVKGRAQHHCLECGCFTVLEPIVKEITSPIELS